MRALRKLRAGAGGVDLVDVAPRPLEPGTVALAVSATGVCGTDLHIEAGEYPTTPPVTMGHEIAGVVTELGPGADASWLDLPVVCETFYDTCGTCAWCLAGRRNLCPSRRSLGSHVDGGFAPRVVVPVRNLHRVPEGVGVRAAALSEPLACVCQALLDPALVNAGDRVLVLGAGPMAQLAAQVAAAMGGRVHMVGLPADRERLGVAASLGATVSESDAPTEVDVAIECSGSQGGARVCLESAARGGRFVQVGVFGRPVTVDLDLVLLKELVLTSGFASTPASWRRAVRLLAERRVRLEPLLSDVLPLGQWHAAFDGLRAGRGLKIALAPDEAV